MSKLGRIVAGAVLVAVAAYFLVPKVFQPEVTNYPSSNTGIVAFGDSLVEGVGSAEGGGFVRILSEELNLPITNLGVSGDTTKDALDRAGEVTRHRPAVTIVLLGGNDFLNQAPEEETFANLEKIIQAIHLSGSAVLLVGVESDIPGNNHQEFFDELAREYKTAYMPDILNGIFGRPELMYDNLHPNDEGYRLVAERIKPVLQKLLK